MLLSKLVLFLLPVVLGLPSGQHPLSHVESECDVPDEFVATTGQGNTPAAVQRIAIIGSGIVGATAAFTLAENARQNSQAPPLSITIFEQNSIVGGRITKTQVFDQAELTIDTCAATFNPLRDTCVTSLARLTGLTPTPVTALDNGTAIWNGQETVGLVEDTGFRDLTSSSNFKRARFRVQYGASPTNPNRSSTEIQSSSIGISAFRSLSQEVSRFPGFNQSLIRGACEGDYELCSDDPQSERYLREVIEAGVRERFFGDYDELNELNSVLGLSTQNNLQSIIGGNIRLVDRLIKISNARLLVNTKVQRLQAANGGKWDLFYGPNEGQPDSVEPFDKVIIATPLSLTDLEILPGMPAVPLLRFADTVVTHFTTRWTLNAAYFRTGLPVPQNILTSATATKTGDKANIPFFSLRLIDGAIKPINSDPIIDPNQKLYKMVSSTNISDAEITQYLTPENGQDAQLPAITWINREYLPKSVPRLDRTVKIQDEIEIRPGLFYAGGGAQVADTIDFGCRMGRNAARMIVNTPRRYNPGNG